MVIGQQIWWLIRAESPPGWPQRPAFAQFSCSPSAVPVFNLTIQRLHQAIHLLIADLKPLPALVLRRRAAAEAAALRRRDSATPQCRVVRLADASVALVALLV
jgi:hypothetical protein